jgi:hypothetical protein
MPLLAPVITTTLPRSFSLCLRLALIRHSDLHEAQDAAATHTLAGSLLPIAISHRAVMKGACRRRSEAALLTS